MHRSLLEERCAQPFWLSQLKGALELGGSVAARSALGRDRSRPNVVPDSGPQADPIG